MSLHFTFHVNGRSIRHAVDIQRLDHADPPDPNIAYEYRARAVAEDGTNPAQQMTATFHHRYGDGPWELVRRAMNALLTGCADD